MAVAAATTAIIVLAVSTVDISVVIVAIVVIVVIAIATTLVVAADQFMYGAIPVAMGQTLDHITDQRQGVADKSTVFKNG